MTPGARKIAVAAAGLALTALAGIAALSTADFFPNPAAAAQATTDYDDDDDGLIDVRTIAQLNAMRWDMNGDGAVAAGDAANYLLAFPNRDTAAATRMGCPETDMPSDNVADCTGYELRADLDFDANDDGSVNSSDTYSGAPTGANLHNWTPIGRGGFFGGWRADFKGNNRTISNLTISSSAQRVGLFGGTENGVDISGVGLLNVNITASRAGGDSAGALAGEIRGTTVRSSYSTGSLTAAGTGVNAHFGGLVGNSHQANAGATIEASWSTVNISSARPSIWAGGLLGNQTNGSITASYAAGSVALTGAGAVAGGLVGLTNNAAITASYAIGPATSTGSGGTAGGLYGSNHAVDPSTITASYWDATTSGIADDADADMPEGKTTRELQSPSPYTDIYAAWNVNVDGNAGNDDPWDFGQAMQYPMLKWDGMSIQRQGSLAMGMPDADTNGQAPTVGRMARVCLTTGPSLRAAGTGGAAHQPWVWQRSTSWSRNLGDAGWTNIAEDGGGTYEYTPVAADRGRYLRACVALRSSDSRAGGTDKACVGPFAPVQ